MPDPGFAPFRLPTKVLTQCPGCGRLNRPDYLAVCGRCWRLTDDAERAVLSQGPDSLRASIYDRVRRGQP